ncbi:MAG TPA: GntG family PLP-dependent aldolase [Candidatus Limnocylindrales bacterium]|nr:GntG family PLP-dependent aldolase [Candidatus Limnocylindrales bacterium]
MDRLDGMDRTPDGRTPTDLIDLRSDTVTRPTPEMRRAMAQAEVGDDVFGDDPTINALEARAAEVAGKEAGLFVTSGTQGNLVCQLAHVPRGGEIIAEAESHTVFDEAAGHAVVTGASMRGLPARPDGTMDPQAIRDAFRDPQDLHEPITALIVLENTHAHTMGQPLTAAYTAEVAAIAHEGGVPLHVDGARIWNAAVALGTTARDLLAPADSATFCLSKGLACPVGSVVVGSADFIWRARRARKLLGGGMRQAGILAAAGLIALRDGPAGMIDRLAEDHANARHLGEALAGLDGIRDLDPERIRTDFVIFRVAGDVARRDAFLEALAARGVLMVPYPHGQVRAVTHYGIDAAGIERTIGAVAEALAEVGAGSGTGAGAVARTLAAAG